MRPLHRIALAGLVVGAGICAGLDLHSKQACAGGICGTPRIDCTSGHVEPANKIVIPESQLTLTDITTNNVSPNAHGFCPRAPNDSSKFLNGSGAWSVPPGVPVPSGTGWWHITNGSSDSTASTPTASDVGADASGAAATVQSNLTTHAGLTTTAHGGLVASTDARLTDARDPKVHASSHGAGQSDAISVVESQLALTDVTTGNSGSDKHGFLPRLPGVSNQWLRSDGTWTTPPGVSGTVWQTVLDLDFSAEASQNLASNGTYSIGGLTWTRVNATADRVALALTNGQGVVFQPKGGTSPIYDYSGANRTCPLLTTPLTGLANNISLISGIRIWCYVSADSIAADGYPTYENTFVGVDSGSMAWGWVGVRGVIRAGGAGAFTSKRQINSSSTQFAGANDASFASHKVHMLEITKLGGFEAHHLSGAWSSGWPTIGSLIPVSTHLDAISTAGGRTNDYIPFASSLVLIVGATNYGTTNKNFSATIARVRVDVLLNQVP